MLRQPLLVEPLICRPEAVHMDAQQRMLLEQSWEVLSAPACGHTTAAAVSTAVVVGIGTVDYPSISAHLGVGIYVATGQSLFNCSIVAPALNTALFSANMRMGGKANSNWDCPPSSRLWGSMCDNERFFLMGCVGSSLSHDCLVGYTNILALALKREVFS